MYKNYIFKNKLMVQKNLSPFIITILFGLLFCGFKSPLSAKEQSDFFTPIQVPLIKGKTMTVGYFDFQKFTGQGAVMIEVTSNIPLTMFTLELEDEGGIMKPILTKNNFNGLLRIDPNILIKESGKKVWLRMQVAENHNLLDKIFLGVKKNNEVKEQGWEFRVATALRDYGADGIHSFRIPGLVTTPKGTLIAVYDVRRNSSIDLQGDIDVGMNRSTDGGQTWEPMKVIMDMGTWGGLPQDQNGIGDPAILVDPETGHIWVAALWAHGKPDQMIWNSSRPGLKPHETGQLMLSKSEDDGITWSTPINITEQIKNPKWNLAFNGPGKGIVLQDGTLVFPAQFKDEEQMSFSTIIYSKNKGESWEIGTGAKSNTTESQVIQLKNGDLMLNMRDNRGGFRSVSITSNLGKTWIEHPTSRKALVEPVCMGSLITHPSKNLLLFSNPASGVDRKNMTIKLSLDDGYTWPEEMQLLLDEGKGWGYSCLTMVDAEHVGILYESSGANITFQLIPLIEILSD